MGFLNDIFEKYQLELDRREQNMQYLHDPTAWVRDKLGMEVWYKQQELFDSVVKYKNTAVRAGHGTSKSTSAAMLALWWIDVHELGTAFVATTAPSADQVGGVIWREIRRFHRMANDRAKEFERPELAILGNITGDNKWKIDGALVASGRKPPDNKAEDAFQGIHAEYVLAIGDESCGLKEPMIDGLRNITTNATSRVLLIGNPTDPRSFFGKIFREFGEGGTGTYHALHISVLDNPNFHGGSLCSCHPDLPEGMGMPENMLRALSDATYVDDKKKEYGEDSPRYIARVLGEFAYESGNSLFSDYDLAQAENCHVMPDPENPVRILGVDVARQGTDYTVLYLAEHGFVQRTDEETGEPTGDLIEDDEGNPIPGIKVRYIDSWQAPFVNQTNQDGTITRGSSERIDEWARALGVQQVRVDASGMGHGVIDPLSATAKPYVIVEMMGGAASPDRRAYLNNRAFQYSEMRRRAFQGTLDLDSKDQRLLDELSGIQYDFADGSSGGGLKIESKESMKRRGVKSPDYADAAGYAIANLDHLFENPYNDYAPGSLVTSDLESWMPEGMSGFHEYSW